jgi:hypothetical protein
MRDNKIVAVATPAVLFSVAAGLIGLWALETGQVPMSGMPMLVGWLLATVVTNIVGAIMAFIRKELISATMCIIFGPVIGLGGAVTTAIQAWGHLPASAGLVNGYVWLFLGIILLIIDIVMWTGPWLMALIQLNISVALIIAGLGMAAKIGAHPWNTIAGWMIFATAVGFLYVCFAALMNETFQRKIIPVGWPLIKVKVAPRPQEGAEA